MTSFFKRSKLTTNDTSKAASKKEPALPPTPLQLLLQDTIAKTDGTDKFYGYENFGNTCYCNSILQCLYNSKTFREAVVGYPHRSLQTGVPNGAISSSSALSRISTEPISPVMRGGNRNGQPQPVPLTRRGSTPASTATPPGAQKPEDKDSPEAKKKAALAAGPILNVEIGNSKTYGMEESLFSAMKDLFESVVASDSRTGVVSPQRFIEVLKMKNELFRSTMHQDAHEFFNYVLNEVIENVEEHAKKNGSKTGSLNSFLPGLSNPSLSTASTTTVSTSATTLGGPGWVHDLFEGALTSETKCLTCENVSRRDEPFLDLSIDLEKHSSVTSCLRNFSASEMLCERNKFHCDVCGGLQEAEKRMKIKRLPKVLALHLKRFKYMEELQRHQKLFHRVVYPYHLRLFNTTDDAEDPDRLYELYAVIVHIGGGPYHGHYVAIVKTEEHGWLLYDDEMVEPVDKSFVRNFFGDRPGLATAYVLFYQETTLEAIEKENMMDAARASAKEAKAKQPVDLKKKPSKEKVNGNTNGFVIPIPHEDVPEVAEPEDPWRPPKTPVSAAPAHKAPTTPGLPPSPGPNSLLATKVPASSSLQLSPVKSKKDREREKKEEKEREKSGKEKEKEERNGNHGLSRFRPGSMSMSGKKGFSWGHKSEKEKEPPLPTSSPMTTTDDRAQSSSNVPQTNGHETDDSFNEQGMNGSSHKIERKEKDEPKHRTTRMLRKKLSILSS